VFVRANPINACFFGSIAS
jgi:hypothetical protein